MYKLAVGKYFFVIFHLTSTKVFFINKYNVKHNNQNDGKPKKNILKYVGAPNNSRLPSS